MSGTSDTPATVFIVDDDDAVGDALLMLLRSVKLPARRFGSALEFLEQYRPGLPGCLLLDVRMPGMSGLQLRDELQRRGIGLPVIFITGHGDVPMAVEAMRLGAFDFLQKPFREEELLATLNRALARDAEARQARHTQQSQQRQLAELTPRELEVARRVARGQANKVIAAELGISSRTVELHRAHVMDKLGVRTVPDLVKLLLAADPPPGG